MDRVWIEDGDREWGSRMDRGWIEDGSRMDRGWMEDGSRMDRVWIEYGWRMDRGWIGVLGVTHAAARRGGENKDLRA